MAVLAMSYAKAVAKMFSILFMAMVMVAGSHLVAHGADGKKDYYQYGKNRGNPANKYDPANPEGQAKKYAPDNPNNPANKYDPANPDAAAEKYAPGNPKNPLNKYDPANPESAGSKYNPDTPLKPR